MTQEIGHDRVRLSTAANSFQAHIWQQGLEREGIRSYVLGDYLDSGIGDIPGITAELWVEPADLARAEEILRQHQDRSEEALERQQPLATGVTIMSGKTDVVKGRIKEAAGALTGNDELRAEGKTDQAIGKVKQIAEKAVDQVEEAVKKVRE